MLTEKRKEGLTILGNYMRSVTLALINNVQIDGLEFEQTRGAVSYKHNSNYVITMTTNITEEFQSNLSVVYCFFNNKNIILNKIEYPRSPDEDFFALSTVLEKLYFERLFVMSFLHDIVLESDEHCVLIDDFWLSTFLAGELTK